MKKETPEISAETAQETGRVLADRLRRGAEDTRLLNWMENADFPLVIDCWASRPQYELSIQRSKTNTVIGKGDSVRDAIRAAIAARKEGSASGLLAGLTTEELLNVEGLGPLPHHLPEIRRRLDTASELYAMLERILEGHLRGVSHYHLKDGTKLEASEVRDLLAKARGWKRNAA